MLYPTVSGASSADGNDMQEANGGFLRRKLFASLDSIYDALDESMEERRDPFASPTRFSRSLEDVAYRPPVAGGEAQHESSPTGDGSVRPNREQRAKMDKNSS